LRKSWSQARKRPTQERSRATYEALVEAAAQVFVRDGYAAATTEAVAERAGVSIGSLYQYFPNKESLLVTLAGRHIDEGNERLAAALSGAVGRPLRALLTDVVEALIALHHDRPALHRIVFEEAPFPPDLRDRMDTNRAVFLGVVEALLAAHPDAAPASRTRAFVVMSAVEGVIHESVHRGCAGLDVATLRDELVDMVHHLITRP
jgi:AcrR family transcriptional regulator